MISNVGNADYQTNCFSDIVGMLRTTRESNGKNCLGCKYIGYDCNGHPECIRDYEHICFKTNYLMREPE